MSHEPTLKPREHGTTISYVTGFILSLIFTLIPYYIVQNHKSVGTTLLAIILGLAVVQLLIQVIFFLHLGRGPKQYWEIYFFIATISLILVVVGGSLVIVTNLHHNMSMPDQQKKLINDEAIYQVGGKLTGACQAIHANHQVIIKNGPAIPVHTTADRCDTITFTNQDSATHTMTFGTHPQHESYGGVSEFELRPGKSQTVTLSEVGAFNFHDHEQPNIAGSFSVLDDSTTN